MIEGLLCLGLMVFIVIGLMTVWFFLTEVLPWIIGFFFLYLIIVHISGCRKPGNTQDTGDSC